MKNVSGSRFQLSPAKLALWKARLEQEGVKRVESNTIPKAKHAELIPASFAQQRLWFLDRMNPGHAVYQLPSALRLTGGLDIPALEKSLTEIARRHESLRTKFLVVDGDPMQVIAAPQMISLPVTDLSDLGPTQREVRAQQLAGVEAQQPFDLTDGTLWRASLLKLADEEHVFLFTMHHIITDGWSMGLLFKELSILYQAYTNNQESPLEDLPLQYSDYAVWQRDLLQNEALQEQLSYWKKQLQNAPPALELPADKPRPTVQTYNAASESFSLTPALSHELKSLSRREGTTLFMTLLAAFQTLLSRYAGRDDILVATPSAGREQIETQSLIGLFVNTLVLRTTVAESFTFVELLQSVKDAVLGAHAHQDLPFEKLIEELDPERNLSYHPLSQALFQLHPAAHDGLKLEGLQCSRFTREPAVVANFDLVLSMSETSPLSGVLNYNSDLFEAETIKRMVEHVERLLDAVVANPQQQIGALSLLTEAESRQLLKDWNDTATSYQRDKCIHELFEMHAAQTPLATALVREEERLTYQELNERANQLAHYLREQGVGPEILVGLCLERSIEMVIAVLGVLKAGGAYVPLDPAYPQERLEFMLTESRVSVLLTQESLPKFPATEARVICLNSHQEQFAERSKENCVSGVQSENLAYVIYTSGSTGKPKGVAVAHQGLCNLCVAQVQQFELEASDRVLQFASLSFDASIFEIVMALCSGAALYLPPRHALPMGEALLDLLRDEEITITVLPPSVVMSLPAESLPKLRTMLVAGEICPAELVERWGAEREFFNLYGPTETTVWATGARCEPRSGKPSIGTPIANARIYVLDHKQRPVLMGVRGEIYIGGAGIARGYLNQFALTAERFVPDPWSDEQGQRLYRTGDLARWHSSGELEYLGRCDQQVKVRGFRIELGEVKATLEQHESVREAVVLVPESANGNEQIVAYVVLDEPETTGEELRVWLRDRLPDYMVPAFFVRIDEIPLTPNGKIDRRVLPQPQRDQIETKRYIAPRNESEQALAAIWAKLLKVDKVGINDNFFALGGHSLLAARLVTQIREECMVQMPLRSVFEAPTVALLARKLDHEKQTAAQDLTTIPRLTRGTTDIDELVKELAQLSEEEVRTLLAREQQYQ